MKRPGSKVRAASLALTGLLFLALFGVLFFEPHKHQALNTRQTSAGSQVKALEETNKPAAPVEKVTEGTGETTATPAELPLPENAPVSDECVRIVEQQQRLYEKDIQQQKERLDKTLAFRVGPNITTVYVQDYNTSVTAILDKAIADTNAKGCVFPPTQPALLPVTYQP